MDLISRRRWLHVNTNYLIAQPSKPPRLLGKFSMGDVIREFKWGAKNGHIS
jgi:hypothetical protein